jgi:hypothetical protein
MIHMRKPIQMIDLGLLPLNPIGGLRSINSTDRLQSREIKEKKDDERRPNPRAGSKPF